MDTRRSALKYINTVRKNLGVTPLPGIPNPSRSSRGEPLGHDIIARLFAPAVACWVAEDDLVPGQLLLLAGSRSAKRLARAMGLVSRPQGRGRRAVPLPRELAGLLKILQQPSAGGSGCGGIGNFTPANVELIPA